MTTTKAITEIRQKLVAVGGYDAANDEIRLIPLSEGADRVRVEAFIVNGQNGAPVTAGNPFQISGTVTVGNSVTIGSLPAISGTVTANLGQGLIDETGDAATTNDEADSVQFIAPTIPEGL